MALSKNNFMAIVMMFLLCLNIVGALDNGEGTSSNAEVIDYENIQISDPSPASTCLSMLHVYCGVSKETVLTMEACAKHGLLYWPNADMRNTPSYVKEYFDKFGANLIAGEFKLPYEYCYYVAHEKKRIDSELSIYEMNDIANRCRDTLTFFRTSRNTIFNLGKYSPMGLRHQMRQDILQYAFYETNIHHYKRGTHPHNYMFHINEYFYVFRPAASCLFVFEEYCGGTNPTMKLCANHGLMHWPKGDDTPDFVEEYFNNFSQYLIAGNFQLPYEFCYEEARIKYSLHPDVSMYTLNDIINRCLDALKYFRSSPRTLGNNELFSIDELKQQMRQDILQFAFYETNLSQYTIKNYGHRYMYHISSYFKVHYLMENPKTFCMKRFSYTDDE